LGCGWRVPRPPPQPPTPKPPNPNPQSPIPNKRENIIKNIYLIYKINII